MKTRLNLTTFSLCSLALAPALSYAQIAPGDAAWDTLLTPTPAVPDAQSARMLNQDIALTQREQTAVRQARILNEWVDPVDFNDDMTKLERRSLFPFWEEPSIVLSTNLNESQKDLLALSYQDTRRQLVEAESMYRTSLASLQAELDKENPSPTEVSRLSDQIADADKSRQKAILNHAATVKNSLTTEQEVALNAAGLEYFRQLTQDRADYWNETGYGASGYTMPSRYGAAEQKQQAYDSETTRIIPGEGDPTVVPFGSTEGYTRGYQSSYAPNPYGPFPSEVNPAYNVGTYEEIFPSYSIRPYSEGNFQGERQSSDRRNRLYFRDNDGVYRRYNDKDNDGEVTRRKGPERNADGPNTTMSGDRKKSKVYTKATATPRKTDTPETSNSHRNPR